MTNTKVNYQPFATRYNVKWIFYSVVAALFFWVCLVASIGYGFNPVGQQVSHYAGQAAFATPEGYANFKTLLASGNVTITSYNELSKEYPVLVSYDVTVPSSIGFNYSEPIETYGGKPSAWRGASAIALTVACGTFLVYAGLKALRKVA